jgi:hypothetical protein
MSATAILSHHTDAAAPSHGVRSRQTASYGDPLSAARNASALDKHRQLAAVVRLLHRHGQ